MFGFLNINKPAGMTSRDVVNHVQRLVRPEKAGHAGTLDPLATGVLIVAIGPATRLIDYVHRLPKRYDAFFRLGLRSDTDDTLGRIEPLDNPIRPTREQIDGQLGSLIGRIWQRPPAYSALRVQGRRAYELARSGKPVDLAAREVLVHSLQVLSYAYPELRLEVTCGSGTYVRALGRDLAAALHTAAVMSALTRTAVGDFVVGQAIRVEDLYAASLSVHVLPPLSVFPDVDPERLSDEEAVRVRQGQAIRRPGHAVSGDVPAIDAAGQMVAVLAPMDDGRLRPVHTFPPDQEATGGIDRL